MVGCWWTARRGRRRGVAGQVVGRAARTGGAGDGGAPTQAAVDGDATERGLGAPACSEVSTQCVNSASTWCDAGSLGLKLMGQGVDVFAQALLQSVKSIDFVFGAAASLVDDLAGAILGRRGELASLLFGFLLSLFDESLRHGDHRGDLLGAAPRHRCESPGADGAAGGGGRHRTGTGAARRRAG